MPDADRLVIDSSVFAAILLREPGHEHLAAHLGTLRTACTAPFFRFEVANAIRKQRHWSTDDARGALKVLFGLPVEEGLLSEDASDAMDLARAHDHPFYDTVFIALARRHGYPLWTLDRKQATIAGKADVKVFALSTGSR